MSLKNLLVTLTVSLLTSSLASISAFAVECAEIEGKLRPVSEKALKIAKVTNSTTCESASFKKIVELKNLKIKTVDASKTAIENFNKMRDAKRTKRAQKQLSKLDF